MSIRRDSSVEGNARTGALIQAKLSFLTKSGPTKNLRLSKFHLVDIWWSKIIFDIFVFQLFEIGKVIAEFPDGISTIRFNFIRTMKYSL